MYYVVRNNKKCIAEHKYYNGILQYREKQVHVYVCQLNVIQYSNVKVTITNL